MAKKTAKCRYCSALYTDLTIEDPRTKKPYLFAGGARVQMETHEGFCKCYTCKKGPYSCGAVDVAYTVCDQREEDKAAVSRLRQMDAERQAQIDSNKKDNTGANVATDNEEE